MKSNKILLKATEFHRISWNQQDLTQFHKIQHNFTKSNRIYWKPEIQRISWDPTGILLKRTEFYRISLNSLHVLLHIFLQISLWMLFMDFTADFIMDFTLNFMQNPPYFIINFITCTRISLKSTRFHEIHIISQDFNEINRISLWISLWIPFQ